ncbi:hypothetical protein GE09DRAFT_1112793 [Coniochaeta sp. 2T2.1]|nr:hypothetical protein GE09DRAFT_1112793 [Coniochaeta sp. 2T2.1]
MQPVFDSRRSQYYLSRLSLGIFFLLLVFAALSSGVPGRPTSSLSSSMTFPITLQPSRAGINTNTCLLTFARRACVVTPWHLQCNSRKPPPPVCDSHCVHHRHSARSQGQAGMDRSYC